MVATPKSTRARPKLRPGQQRRKYIRARRPRRLDDPIQNDDARRDWTAHQKCIGVGRLEGHVCAGRIEVCHEGKKPGVAMKCPDSQAVPMCSFLHGRWTNHRGPFEWWSKAKRRDWMDPIIDEVQARYLSHGSRRG